MSHTYTIRGRIKPYVRMTQRSKWRDPQAREYLACKLAVGLQFKTQMRDHEIDALPGQTPLQVHITLWEAGGFHNKDLDNQVKAILDAAQGIVFPDDRWVDRIVAERKRGGCYAAEVAFEILYPTKEKGTAT